MPVEPVYWTKASATGGGRNGLAKLADGKLTITMAAPKEMGGSGAGHNPEELFAIGYAACFLSSMRFVVAAEKLGMVPESATVTAHVGIGPHGGGGYGIAVKLEISLPGVPADLAATFVKRGHDMCPYSHFSRGGSEVEVALV